MQFLLKTGKRATTYQVQYVVSKAVGTTSVEKNTSILTDTELHKFKCELEADNKGVTEVLEKRSLELDVNTNHTTTPNNNHYKENRWVAKIIHYVKWAGTKCNNYCNITIAPHWRSSLKNLQVNKILLDISHDDAICPQLRKLIKACRYYEKKVIYCHLLFFIYLKEFLYTLQENTKQTLCSSQNVCSA